MSTSYFALRHPVVRVQRTSDISSVYDLTTADPHWWIGALTMEALGILADRDVQVAHRGNAGDIVVTHPGPDDMQAISERGDLVTLGQLRRGEAP